MKKMNKKGFTIVELVIVIAVIAILAAVLIPTFSGVIEKANKSAAMQYAASLYKEAFALDLADGVADGMEGTVEIATVKGKTVDYENNGTTISFSYDDGKYISSYNGSAWTVANKNS
jgi:type IV pilus assembly protein PilA